MDFAALLSTGALLRRKPSLKRLLLAAAFGGVYAVGRLFLPADGAAILLPDLLVGALLCRIAFGKGSASDALLRCLLFLALSLFIGGLVTALYGFLSRAGFLEEGGSSGAILLLQTALLTAGGAMALGRQVLRERRKQAVTVRLVLLGQQVTLQGLLDSGHLAREPLSGLPVIILTSEAAAGLLPGDLLQPVWTHPEALPEDLRKRLRMIPMRSLLGRGVLPAFRADTCEIRGETVDVCIAIAPPGQENPSFGGFGALIPGDLLPTGTYHPKQPGGKQKGGHRI